MADLASSTPVWLAALSIVVNAVAGSLTGLLDEDRHWDVVGVATFAVVMGLGGGVARDLLLGVPPQALRSTWPLAAALAGAVLAVPLARLARRRMSVAGCVDALALSLFAMTGVAAASAQGLPALPSVLVGVVSAVGGGVLLAVVRGEVPDVLQPGRPQALTAAAIALGYLLLARHDANAAYVVCATAAVAIHLVSERIQLRTRPVVVGRRRRA